jgi:hypothetical protein
MGHSSAQNHKFRRVIHIDKEGNRRKFQSIERTALRFGVSHTTISEICRYIKPDYKGDRFEYDDKKLLQAAKRKSLELHGAQDRAVNQLDKNKKVIKRFDRITQAADQLNIHARSIVRVCKGRQQSSYNLYFAYPDKIYQHSSDLTTVLRTFDDFDEVVKCGFKLTTEQMDRISAGQICVIGSTRWSKIKAPLEMLICQVNEREEVIITYCHLSDAMTSMKLSAEDIIDTCNSKSSKFGARFRYPVKRTPIVKDETKKVIQPEPRTNLVQPTKKTSRRVNLWGNIEKVDPKTGKVIEVFSTQREAAGTSESNLSRAIRDKQIWKGFLWRRNLLQGQSKRGPPGRPVFLHKQGLPSGKIYPTVTEAALASDINRTRLGDVCRNANDENKIPGYIARFATFDEIQSLLTESNKRSINEIDSDDGQIHRRSKVRRILEDEIDEVDLDDSTSDPTDIKEYKLVERTNGIEIVDIKS